MHFLRAYLLEYGTAAFGTGPHVDVGNEDGVLDAKRQFCWRQVDQKANDEAFAGKIRLGVGHTGVVQDWGSQVEGPANLLILTVSDLSRIGL